MSLGCRSALRSGEGEETAIIETTATLTPAYARQDETTVAAPYALVRTTALALPASTPETDRFRRTADRLTTLIAWCAEAGGELADVLHEHVASASPDLRNRVLLPLRRDVHNQRTPRPALRDRLADLPQRLPLLAQWLAARDEIERIVSDLDDLAGPALAADRRALAELCGAESLRRAVSMTSHDLLHAVERAAVQGIAPDARARKSEATVVRYAMRAATKTTPLSWFAHVGWGQWQGGRADETVGSERRPGEVTEGPDRVGSLTPVAASQADRSMLAALLSAILDHRDLREGFPHRLAPGVRTVGTRVHFRRPSPVGEAASPLGGEQEASLPLTPPLRYVLARVRSAGTVLPGTLAADIAVRLPGPPERVGQAGAEYVTGLIDHRLLQPAWPIDPQAPDGARRLARWLAGIGLADLARVVADIASQTTAIARVSAADRAEALWRLRSRWAQAFAMLDATPHERRMPVTEDVTVRDVLRLGADHGRDVLPDLVRLMPLFEIFDQFTVVRRAIRDRFVDRFGVGGSCDSITEFADECGAAWRTLDLFDPERGLTAEDRLALGPGLLDLARIRGELAAAVPEAGGDGEIHLPDQVVRYARHALPGSVRARPTSYAVFAQAVSGVDRTRLCVNHVYGGWGRFTSRFLDYLEPAACDQVAAQIRRGAGSAQVAQVRPVGGFNANLHPLLVGDEIADEAPWGTLRPEELELVHDVDSDQVRVRISATGALIDVLYLGFLVPMALPGRLGPLLMDQASGLIDLKRALVPKREVDTALGRVHHWPRLRYRDVYLSRAQWLLSPSMVQAWREELDSEPGPPARAAARWRATLRLPERVFISAAPQEGTQGLERVLTYFSQARSQYMDLASALHLLCLSRTLARYPHGVVLEEALPEPRAGVPATELVAELYRRTP